MSTIDSDLAPPRLPAAAVPLAIEETPPSDPAAGGVLALVIAALLAGAIGLYRPPGPTPPSYGPGWITATVEAKASATRAAVAIALAATATSQAAQAATATAAAAPTATPTAALVVAAGSEGVPLDPPAPYFTFRRPFDSSNETRASRFYPYGTTGGGAYLLHHGVDIGNAMGTPVLAVGDGEVVFAGDDLGAELWGPQPDFFGRLVTLRHPGGLGGQPLYSLYGHLSEVKVQPGQEVKAGETIGLVGMAGIALGPHLHLEFRNGADPHDYESTRNPEIFLAPHPGQGTIIGRLVDAENRLLPDVTLGLYAVGADGGEDWISQSTTYPNRHVNPDAAFDENFVFADTPAGRYVVAANVGGRRVSGQVEVVDGGVVGVALRAP
jgi:murein DD-endopeptidase MepM/ murein hydrolase activator NlpD